MDAYRQAVPLAILCLLLAACGSRHAAPVPPETPDALRTAVAIHAHVALTEVALANTEGAAADATIVARADAQLTAVAQTNQAATATAIAIRAATITARETHHPTPRPAPRVIAPPSPVPVFSIPRHVTVNGAQYKQRVLIRCCEPGEPHTLRSGVFHVSGPWALAWVSDCLAYAGSPRVVVRVAGKSGGLVDEWALNISHRQRVGVRIEGGRGTFTAQMSNPCARWVLLLLRQPGRAHGSTRTPKSRPASRPTSTPTPPPTPTSTIRPYLARLTPLVSDLHRALKHLQRGRAHIRPSQTDFNPQALVRARADVRVSESILNRVRKRLARLVVPASASQPVNTAESVLGLLESARKNLRSAVQAVRMGDTATATRELAAASRKLGSARTSLERLRSELARP